MDDGWIGRMVREFLKDENGAVTVDWVVLTAASVGMGLAVMEIVSGSVENFSTDLADYMQAIEIRTTFAEWDAFRADQIAAPADEGDGGGNGEDPPDG